MSQLTPPGFIPDASAEESPKAVMPPGFVPDEASAVPPEAPPRTWGDTAVDVAKGFAKGAGRTVMDAAQGLMSMPAFGTSTQALDAIRAQPAVAAKEAQVKEGLQSTNAAQSVGGLLEAGAEMVLPGKAMAEAVPTAARAGAKFQEVMGAARHVPVDVNAPGQVALRIHELAEHGGSMPMAVRKFINYVTDPTKPQMTYEVARDFASNISTLSVDEMMRLKPATKREVANLAATLNRAVADAAGKAGKGAEYAQAMNQYARAMKIRDVVDSVIAGAKKSAPYGLGVGVAGGLGYQAGKKLFDLWSGE